MDSLFWAVVPVLNAVHPMEEHVQELKQELVQEVEMALVPLQRYLDQVGGVKLQCSSVGACFQRRTWSPALTEQLKKCTVCTPFCIAHNKQHEELLALSQEPHNQTSAMRGPDPLCIPQYKQHEELLALSPEAYVAALEAKGEDLSLTELKADVKRHMAELEALQEALPVQGIAVGIAFVQTTKVRHGCSLLVHLSRRVGRLKALQEALPVQRHRLCADNQVDCADNQVEEIVDSYCDCLNGRQGKWKSLTQMVVASSLSCCCSLLC